MKKTQLQRNQWISGMWKGATPAPEPIPYYADHVQLFESLRLMEERDMEGASEEVRELVSGYTETAWKAVWQRYRFFVDGGSAYQKTTKAGNKKQISVKAYNSLSAKQKRGYEKIVRNASGGTLEAGRLCEMFLAARAAAIAGYRNPLTDKWLEPGLKAASAAAANELRRGLQTPLFEDIAQAEKWQDKAWEIHRKTMENTPQNFDPERLPSRDEMAAFLWNARKRITISWKSTGSKRWKHGRKSAFRLLRSIIASAYAGVVCTPEHDSALRKAIDSLVDAIHKPLAASDLQDITAIKPTRHKPLPENRIRLWRSGGVSGWVEYAAIQSQAPAKQELMDIPTPAVRVKTYRQARKNFAGMILAERVTKLVHSGGIIG